jgi:hypothetical protein
VLQGAAPGEWPSGAQEKLERLDLARASSFKDRAMRALVLGALRSH